MHTRTNILTGVLFVVTFVLGGLVGRHELKENWTSPEQTQNMHIEMGELRKFIDSRCDGCSIKLAQCTKERHELTEELNLRCKNVIKYAVTLELENSRLNKIIDRCRCSR